MIKLSIVVICWNDLRLIGDCLKSIYSGTQLKELEVIVSDNGSTDGSVKFIREHFPAVRVVENGTNLRFSKANNVGIHECKGEFILILNPDTIIHQGTLDKWLEFIALHPEAGAFGCRVLNPDGTNQNAARPFPTIWREWIAALYLRPLEYISSAFMSDLYFTWNGESERVIDWQSGCCVMFRRDVLERLGGFDEQFFYHYEEVDLCKRVWDAGYPILYTPRATITHLGGQSSAKRFPVPFELDKYRNRYRYFYKYYGKTGARRCRRVSLISLRVRQCGYGLLRLVKRSESLKQRLALYEKAIEWNRRLDPVRFVEEGREPVI